MLSNTKEFQDLMASFERVIKSGYLLLGNSRLDKEARDMWSKGIYYQNGEVNNAFKAFISGYQLAKSLARIDALPLEG